MSEHLVEERLLSRPFEVSQVADVRRLVGNCAASVGLSESARQDFVLAVDEIVTNAIRHGGGRGHLELWTAEGRLWFLVSDEGPGMTEIPSATPPSPNVLSGRGLWIARQMTDELTISSSSSGTVVTGAVRLDRQ